VVSAVWASTFPSRSVCNQGDILGRSAQVAIVLDRASLRRGDTGKVTVDFFSEAGGGQRVFSVDLTREDFKRASSWWPF